MSKIEATKRDVIWNYLGTIMTLSSSFLLLPFMMYFISGDEVGLWYIFLSVGGIVTLFDFGFAPTMARNIAYCWSGAEQLSKYGVTFVENKEPNFILLKKIISTCKVIYLIISILALLILISIGTVYISYISRGLTTNTHMIAWFIFCFAIFLNLYYGYFTSLLSGIGAVSKRNIANVISRSSQIILSIILLVCGFGLIAISIAYCMNGIIYRIISKKFFYEYGNIKIRLEAEQSKISLKEIKNIFEAIWFNAWRDGLVSLANYLALQASTIICSLFISLADTGAYSISLQLINGVASIAATLYNAYQPSLQSAYVTNNLEKSKRLLSVSITVYIAVFIIGVVGLVTIGVPILSYLKPEIRFDILMIMAIAVYIFLSKHHSIYASYISNTNAIPYVKAFISSSFLGLLLAFILIKNTNLGIWGLILAQIIAQIIYNNWKWPVVVMNDLSTNPIEIMCIGLKEIKYLLKPKC